MSCYEEENPECGNGLRDGCELLQWLYGNGSVDTCSFSKTSDDMYFRDFNIIVLNQFFVYSN